MMAAILLPALLLQAVWADLRMASQPRNGYKARDRNRNVPFVPDYALYMEPSDFNYAKLARQRDGGGYDNFLRSNIDNEQDKRNFRTEPGRDHLPFRSYETAATDVSDTVKNKLATLPTGAARPSGAAITTTPGEPFLVPLRWNNPHSSELEVNIWIMDRKYVVPIRKPTCSGEGHQDNVFWLKVPTNFNAQVAARVPGFRGCKRVGDCVLQIYAHSVEPRMYAMGTPLIVAGTVPTATTTLNVEAAKLDVGLDIKKLPRSTCLPSNETAQANIANAVPRRARMVSDQFTHAYMNSNQSPYSGQQPDAISRNLQASCVLKMVSGNRGELGRDKLRRDNRPAFNFQRRIARKVNHLIRHYEGITNTIITAVGDISMRNTDAAIGSETAQFMTLVRKRINNRWKWVNTTQQTTTCFRCSEVGAVNARRLQTNTYVPSFSIPADLVATVKMYVAPIFLQPTGSFLEMQADGSALLLIYETVLADMREQFIKAAELGIGYQAPVLKSGTATMSDTTKFLKVKADDSNDNGYYASTQAQAVQGGTRGMVVQQAFVTNNTDTGRRRAQTGQQTMASILALTMDTDESPLIAAEGEDMNGVYFDSACDDDATANLTDLAVAGNCTIPGKDVPGAFQMFADEGQAEISTSRSISNLPGTTSAAVAEDDGISFSTIAFVLLITACIIVGFWTGKLPCLSKEALPQWCCDVGSITARLRKKEPTQTEQASISGDGDTSPKKSTPAEPDLDHATAIEPAVRSSQRSRSAVKRTEITDAGQGKTTLKALPRLADVDGRPKTPPRRALPELRP